MDASIATGYEVSPLVPNVAGGNKLAYPVFNKVWGVLTGMEIRGNYTNTNGSNTVLYSNDAVATFLSPDGDASLGLVHINSTAMTAVPQNSYTNPGDATFVNQSNSPADSVNFGSSCKWTASNNKYVPNISYNYSGNFPAFTGLLPLHLSAANDYSITFNADNTFNADSAFIAITGENGSMWYSNIVSTNGGTATFPASKMQYVIYGYPDTYLEIFVFKYTIKTFGNKRFAFLKISENVQNISIN